MAGMYGCFKGKKSSHLPMPYHMALASSDRGAMASGPPDVMANQEPAEVQEESSGKKKSKFQTFKKFFARKKRKEPSAAGADAVLKASQSSDNVSKTSENNTLTRSEKDKGSGSKISLGSKALSHDSVFVSDSSEANEALGASQDSIHGKVKSLQLQLKQAIKLGSPPSLICMKGREDAGTMSEDDGLPCSPPEYCNLHAVMNQAERNSTISLDRDDDQLSCAASSRAVSPLVVPGDFSQPASPFGCLDNSAAKHKMGLRHKACNKRKPASRLEVKAETDSVDEVLNTSITEPLAEHEQQKTEVASFDELKLKVEEEEEEEVEEEEEEEGEVEKEQPQHSIRSLSRDKEEGEEEREEGEDESEAEQDVSHGPDTTSPPQPNLSEEEVSDVQPLPSSKPSFTASSVETPRATPEPPAGPREYLLDPPGIAYGAEENRIENELALRGEEDGVQENTGEEEEESSLLQEVLSSLKTPLESCSLGMETESGILQMEEEVKEKDSEEFEIEEGEEMKEEEPEVDEAVSFQAAPSGSILLVHTTEEEEETATVSCQEEDSKEEEPEEEKDVVVEHGLEAEKEEAEEVKPEEEYDELTRQTDIQVEEEVDEEYQSEGEEEAIELEKEPEVEEEGREKTEEPDDEEVKGHEAKERVEEAEEAIEEEKDDAEEITERFPDATDDEAQIAVPLQEADEGVDVVVGDETLCITRLHTDDEENPPEVGDEVFTILHECQANYNQNSGDERDNGEEEEEQAGEYTQQKSEPEDNVEANQQVADQTEQEQEVPHLDWNKVENDQTEAKEQATVSSKPSSLSLVESHIETHSQESGSITPSKTSTTTIHINLVSPSSEKVTSFFQQSPTTAQPKERESPPLNAAAEQATASADEAAVDIVEEIKEEKRSDLEEEATPAESVEETMNQTSNSSDHSKSRFTIAPAWQRSQSSTSLSSPPASLPSSPSTATGPGGKEWEAASIKDPATKAEPASAAKVELVLSPGRVRNAGSISAKLQSNAVPSPCSVKPHTAANTEGSSVTVEGNPDNPFGIRLRKTSALQLFSSEEENTETPTETPTQPNSCKAEPPQPISVKPLISQPVSNKPALPKKPDVHGDSGGKTKRSSDPAAGHGGSGGSDSPSWISVAKQKQKIYKENSLDEITLKKEEPERKNSLPTYVTSAAIREQSNKPAESGSKVNLLEISKPLASVEKEARRALSPPTPVPPKPQVLPATIKPPPQPNSAPRSLSPPTPVPVSQKSPSRTSPPSLSKAALSLPLSKTTQPQSTTVASPPFSSRTTLESTGSRAPGVPGQTPSGQRGLPAPALPQDEPPWMALAKKKAKAWSEMPQIVQ